LPHVAWLHENTVPEQAFDILIEATGSTGGFTQARQAVRSGRTIILKSTYKSLMSINLASLVIDEITLMGSHCRPFAPALRLLENRLLDPTSLIEADFPLQKGLQAFEYATQAGTLKILLHLNPG
jgi:threonine dehydrogenase-like Zn-dependent dehydrogenase